jgi:hypothetical protein
MRVKAPRLRLSASEGVEILLGGLELGVESHGPARIAESEAGVAGCALGECGSEDGNFDIVIVMDLGGLLVRTGSEDAAGVLDEAPLERDRACQEQRVECGTVEAFAAGGSFGTARGVGAGGAPDAVGVAVDAFEGDPPRTPSRRTTHALGTPRSSPRPSSAAPRPRPSCASRSPDSAASSTRPRPA